MELSFSARTGIEFTKGAEDIMRHGYFT